MLDRLGKLFRWLRTAAAPPPNGGAGRGEPKQDVPPAPPDPRHLYHEAGRLFDAGEFDTAESAYLQYAAESPGRAADGYAGAARAVWQLRNKREISAGPEAAALPPGRRHRCITYYRRALAADPNHVRSMEGLYRLLPADDSYRMALLRRAAELQDSPALLLALGDEYRVAGDVEAAVRTYESAVRRAARERAPYERLADLCESLGRRADARRWRRAMSERFGLRGRETFSRSRRRLHSNTPTPAAPIWCVVANVADEHRAGPGGAEVRHGTRLLAPGAKVYVLHPMWGVGGESAEVIGHHRHGRRYISTVVQSDILRHARAKCVYSPHVIREMRGLWDGSDESRRRAEELNSRS